MKKPSVLPFTAGCLLLHFVVCGALDLSGYAKAGQLAAGGAITIGAILGILLIISAWKD